jgi:hypothetical protein
MQFAAPDQIRFCGAPISGRLEVDDEAPRCAQFMIYTSESWTDVSGG